MFTISLFSLDKTNILLFPQWILYQSKLLNHKMLLLGSCISGANVESMLCSVMMKISHGLVHQSIGIPLCCCQAWYNWSKSDTETHVHAHIHYNHLESLWLVCIRVIFRISLLIWLTMSSLHKTLSFTSDFHICNTGQNLFSNAIQSCHVIKHALKFQQDGAWSRTNAALLFHNSREILGRSHAVTEFRLHGLQKLIIRDIELCTDRIWWVLCAVFYIAKFVCLYHTIFHHFAKLVE